MSIKVLYLPKQISGYVPGTSLAIMQTIEVYAYYCHVSAWFDKTKMKIRPVTGQVRNKRRKKKGQPANLNYMGNDQ